MIGYSYGDLKQERDHWDSEFRCCYKGFAEILAYVIWEKALEVDMPQFESAYDKPVIYEWSFEITKTSVASKWLQLEGDLPNCIIFGWIKHFNATNTESTKRPDVDYINERMHVVALAVFNVLKQPANENGWTIEIAERLSLVIRPQVESHRSVQDLIEAEENAQQNTSGSLVKSTLKLVGGIAVVGIWMYAKYNIMQVPPYL